MKRVTCIILVIGFIALLCSCASNSSIEQTDSTHTSTDKTQYSTSSTESIEITDSNLYTLNNVSFSVPISWIAATEKDNLISFLSADETLPNDRIIVKSEKIPEIMKIDTGDGKAILSKFDIPKQYGASLFGSVDITEEKWIKKYDIDCCEQSFVMMGNLDNGEKDNRTGHSFIIPINETEGYFAVYMVLSPESNSVSDMETIVNSITIDNQPQQYTEAIVINKVYEAYNAAVNMTKSDLIKEGNFYYYKNIPLLLVDTKWIENPLNKKGTVEACALYRKMSYCLVGFEIGNSWSSYAEMLLGFVPSSREEMRPYVNNALEFIVKSESAYDISKAVMKKLKGLSCVNGTFDFDNNSYDVRIDDLTQCSEEMLISEEMFGYVIAAFNSMAAKVSFDNNSCTIVVSLR